MGRFTEFNLAFSFSPETPFVGYVNDEYTPRPVLIWSLGGRPFESEGEYAE